MGTFYTNFSVKTEDQQKVASVLHQHGRKAYVGPPSSGTILVVEEVCDSQDENEILGVGAILSAETGCPVLSILNHDDSILCYWLFLNGEVVDQYNSTPDYFNFIPAGIDIMEAMQNYQPAPPEGGDAKLLCDSFGCPHSASDVETILRKPSTAYVFAMERHQDLVNALGTSNHSLGTAFASFEYEELPEELDQKACIKVG
jgi:hypothetical protein